MAKPWEVQTWEVLRRAGVPDGPARRAEICIPDAAPLRAAVGHVLTHGTGAEVELLCAWLDAFEHDWPTSYRAYFGADGPWLLAEARSRVVDPGKHLELRRIALTHLATAL